MRHAKNLMRFLNRSFQDLPDQQLVSPLDDFFNMLETSLDHRMQLPLEQDLRKFGCWFATFTKLETL